jgi:GT2 family glycosyltransferase
VTPEPGGLAPAVTAVVVTYNRLEMITRAVTAVLAQDRPPDSVIVVDNASTDGTARRLSEFEPRVRVLTLTQNTGGAGGFAIGLQAALADGADAVWLLDDDAEPATDALRQLLAAYTGYAGATPALVASHVVWTDGSTHRMNMPRRRRDASLTQISAAESVGCTPIRTASFVSVLVDGAAARAEGPVEADYFLWNDDVEYTARLLRRRVGLRCAASVVTHHTPSNYNTLAESGDRLYLDVRNMLWFIGRSPGLALRERAFFAAITVRRWFRTFQRSKSRRDTVVTIGRAILAAARHGPRPTDETLASVGVAEAPGLPPMMGTGSPRRPRRSAWAPSCDRSDGER